MIILVKYCGDILTIIWEVGVINSERSEEGVEQSRGMGATEE